MSLATSTTENIRPDSDLDCAFETLLSQLASGRLPQVQALRSEEPLAIYGAGGFGRQAAQLLQSLGHPILGFIDQRGTGVNGPDGLPIYPAQAASFAELRRRGAQTAVIGVFNSGVALDAIAEMLISAGFERALNPLEMYDLFSSKLGWRYFMATRSWYEERVNRLAEGLDLWGDEESRRTYQKALLFRVGWQLNRLQAPDIDHQYFPETLPIVADATAGPLRIVDGGAFTGDTLVAMRSAHIPVGEYFAFEPDAVNFRNLRATIDGSGQEGTALLWPCGLWSSTTQLSFQSGNGPSSHIIDGSSVVASANQHTTTVAVAALDDVLPHRPIDLIKLDIEGAEPEALKGAQDILTRHRPALAVCAYHHPQHLWELAQQIQAMSLSYRCYLRSHGHNTLELVMYALP